MNSLQKQSIGLIAWVVLVLGAACAQPVDEPAPYYKRTVEPRSKLVLYTPSRYGVSTTFSSASGAGFRLEDPKRETLAAVIEIPSANVILPSSSDPTSASYATGILDNLMVEFRDHITELLPFADRDQKVGDWTLTAVNNGTTRDLRGNHVAYAHYSLQVVPIYQLRSPEVIQYLARIFLGANWAGFPRNDAVYYPAGQNTVEIVIAVSVHNDIGYANDSDRLGISFAALPSNNSTIGSVADLDDILAFKTLGNARDKLVSRTKTFKVGKRNEPVDMIFSVDGNQTMREEHTTIKAAMVELIGELAADPTNDFHIAFLTNGSAEFVPLSDGSRFLTADSKKPDELAGLALDAIFSNVFDLSHQPRNDLLRRSVLAITEPTNAGFERVNAPLLLAYLSDRDDNSPALDNSAISSGFATRYANWIRAFDHWIAFVPSKAGCLADNLDTAAAADKVYVTGYLAGAAIIDMCARTPLAVNDAILTWNEENSSSFHFSPPQPMAFSLKVSANGNRLPQNLLLGYLYDFMGDRLLFGSTSTPREGDEIGVSYLTLEAPVVYEKR